MKDVRAKKALGQHFLNDEEIARNIVASLRMPNAHTMEIGPGMGVLTQFLLEKNIGDLKVVELDPEAVSYLQNRFPALSPNIIAADFLKLNLSEIYDSPISLIGNFPYNISSQILFKILENRDLITETVGMFQKEVAERIAASPGRKVYGILSVLLQAFFDIEYLFTVHENAFNPPPGVKSAVIRLVRNPEKNLACDPALFKTVVKTAFNRRRKTLRNSLKNFAFSAAFLDDEIFTKRPEQLSVTDFERITRALLRDGETGD